jgi:hypothetical protein
MAGLLYRPAIHGVISQQLKDLDARAQGRA